MQKNEANAVCECYVAVCVHRAAEAMQDCRMSIQEDGRRTNRLFHGGHRKTAAGAERKSTHRIEDGSDEVTTARYSCLLADG